MRGSFLMLFPIALLLLPAAAELGEPGTEVLRETAPEHPVPAVTLRVSVWDDTEGRPVRGRSEVWLRGAGSWYPDLSYGGDTRNFSGRRVGSVDTLMWYPEGRDRPEIPVPVPITRDLCPEGCARDLVTLAISDNAYTAFAPGMAEEIEVRRR